MAHFRKQLLQPPTLIYRAEILSSYWYKGKTMVRWSKCTKEIRYWLNNLPNQLKWLLDWNVLSNFKSYKLSEPANGVLSLQMVADVRLCFYYNTRSVSVTKASFKVLLLFIDHSIQGVSVGNWDQLSTHTDYKAQVRRQDSETSGQQKDSCSQGLVVFFNDFRIYFEDHTL